MENYLISLSRKYRKDRRYLLVGLVIITALVSLNVSLRFNQNAPWFDDFSAFVEQTIRSSDPITDAQKYKLIKEFKQSESEVSSLTKSEASNKIDRLVNPSKYSQSYSLLSDIKSKIIANATITGAYVFFILLMIAIAWYYGGQKSFVLIAVILSATYFFYDILYLFKALFFIEGLSALGFSTVLYLLPYESPIDKKEEKIREYEVSIIGYENRIRDLGSDINQLKKYVSEDQEIIVKKEHDIQRVRSNLSDAIREKEKMQGYEERGESLRIGVYGMSVIDDSKIEKAIKNILHVSKDNIEIIETDYTRMTNHGPKAFINNLRYTKKWLIIGKHPHSIEGLEKLEAYIEEGKDWNNTQYVWCGNDSLEKINKSNLNAALEKIMEAEKRRVI